MGSLMISLTRGINFNSRKGALSGGAETFVIMALHHVLYLSVILHLGLAATIRNCGRFGVANSYGSHMVLQRRVESRGAVVWGYAVEVGDTVTLEINGEEATTQAFQGTSGRPEWRMTLRYEEGGPYQINIRSEGCSVTLDDVLFGDVWFCSGQSNMVHILRNIDDPEPELADIENHPNVRAFRSAQRWSDDPQHDLLSVSLPWGRPTRNTIQGFSAVCWLFGVRMSQLYNRPIGLVKSVWGGTRIEAWSSPDALQICYPDGVPPRNNQNGESALWNALVNPLLSMSITGALWYQGEANSRQLEYECALREMVADWRMRWSLGTEGNTDPQFGFGVVQLAPNQDRNNAVGFPEVRWAQSGFEGNTPTERLPNVFMSVAIDLPDFNSPHGSIHPRYKRQIAERLVLGARAITYGEDITFQGPMPLSYVREGNVLSMDYGQELEIRDTAKNFYFEACCSSDPSTDCLRGGGGYSFISAPIVASTDTAVSVEAACPQGQEWVGVRYLWRESPCALEMCPIYGENLPAPP